MKASEINLREMLDFRPDEGKLLLQGRDRLLLFRLEAFATLRRMLFEQLGERSAKTYLAQFGYRCGFGDHQALSTLCEWNTEHDEVAAGPVIHMWEGLVHVDLEVLTFDKEKRDYLVRFTWRNSYEAEIHLDTFGRSDAPVCHTLAGYASGWSTSFMGSPMLCIERSCVGRGDPVCFGEIRPAHAWGQEADPWREALEGEHSLWRDLTAREHEIEAYRQTLNELETPIIEVWEGVVVVPVIGVVDARRGVTFMEIVLRRVASHRVECVIFDLTGMESATTETLDQISKVAEATRLLGASFILSGVRPEVAAALVRLGVDTTKLSTCRTLEEGLKKSFALLGYRIERSPSKRDESASERFE